MKRFAEGAAVRGAPISGTTGADVTTGTRRSTGRAQRGRTVVDWRLSNGLHATDTSIYGGTRSPLTNDVKPGAGVTAKVGTGRDRSMGHDWSGDIGLDEHAVR